MHYAVVLLIDSRQDYDHISFDKSTEPLISLKILICGCAII